MDKLNTTHLPRAFDAKGGAEYVGPLSLWKGKKAMAAPMMLVQMDDLGQYMAQGWHLFNASDWKVPEMRPVFQVLASACTAVKNCLAKDNKDWAMHWSDVVREIEEDYLPRGSGFDQGTKVDIEASSDGKLVLGTNFHHMDENGFYSGWTNHQIFVTPSLIHGFTIRVTGPNRNGIKEYLADTFNLALSEKVAQHA